MSIATTKSFRDTEFKDRNARLGEPAAQRCVRACLEVHEVLLRVGQPVGEEGVDEGAGVARRGVRRREEGRELLATHLALRTLLPEFAEVSAGEKHFQ